mmetsp:Transcript_3729/g.23425  ORF Transcript_3729/g.23425 Transcript_3729/m.23425 type:complete len:113 (-) Transcript_3729:1387-1725(-)
MERDRSGRWRRTTPGARQDQRASRGPMHAVPGSELGTSAQHHWDNDQIAYDEGELVAVLRTFVKQVALSRLEDAGPTRSPYLLNTYFQCYGCKRSNQSGVSAHCCFQRDSMT